MKKALSALVLINTVLLTAMQRHEIDLSAYYEEQEKNSAAESLIMLANTLRGNTAQNGRTKFLALKRSRLRGIDKKKRNRSCLIIRR